MTAPVLLRESELSSLAAVLVPLLRAGDVVCLQGDLGAGKTTLARALIRAATDDATEVPSPTFTLVQTYDDARPVPIWHFDLYRLKQPDDVLETGWEEARATGAALVEWSDRLGSFLPRDRLDITLAPVAADADLRAITCMPQGTWLDRIAPLTRWHDIQKTA